MRLLVFTQAVDRDDPILGFFHHWLEEFAPRYESLNVICLKEGRHSLPNNVRVYSLGKEKGRSRLKYLFRFYQYLWALRHDYDAVFVHMNQEYAILGGWLWRLLRKRVYLWRNFPTGNFGTDIAVFFSNRVFCTARNSYTARFKKTSFMPVGIDTNLFAPQSVPRERKMCYMQGRVDPSKRIHILLQAIATLQARGIDARAHIVGPEDPEYVNGLRTQFADLIEAGSAAFLGPKRNEDTPALYASHGIAINLAPAGHFDKTAFEPMACERPLITSSLDFAGIVPSEWIVTQDDPEALAEAIERMIALPEQDYQALGKAERLIVVRDHSLPALAERLHAILSEHP